MNSAPSDRIRHAGEPISIDLLSSTLQCQYMSRFINQSRHCKVRYLLKRHAQHTYMMCNRSEHRFILLLPLNIFYNCQRITFHNQSTENHPLRED
ncbi:hypothetical protein ES332_D11G334100v1 [Gossypium tomentosum]|uniref:Uncharacterized protein n=1 Tax=Gossypium tomentosum TaxID=34277 RepID=A0A5D2IWF0_GOSTO|nr:hypothetical protein ES332_D11G334100v1 [Gossypium tomentosum]